MILQILVIIIKKFNYYQSKTRNEALRFSIYNCNYTKSVRLQGNNFVIRPAIQNSSRFETSFCINNQPLCNQDLCNCCFGSKIKYRLNTNIITHHPGILKILVKNTIFHEFMKTQKRSTIDHNELNKH